MNKTKKHLISTYLLISLPLIIGTIIPQVKGNPGPDLTNRGPSYDAFTPNKAVPGGTNITVWCDVLNQGDTASGDFNVSFYASINAIISQSDYEIGKIFVSSLSASTWTDVSWSGPFPSDIPNDTYYIGWIIDVDSNIVEENEGNNIAYETVSLLNVVIEAELYNRGGPNGGFQYSGYTPTEVMPSVTMFTIWCDIENVGLKASGDFNVSFRASWNPIISVISEEIAKVFVPSINSDSYADVSWTGIFPSIPFDWYYVGWVIDVDNDVVEGSEDDVGIAEFSPLKVSDKPDLTDRGSSFSGLNITSAEPGVTPFLVSAEIENIGLQPSGSCNVSFYASLDNNITGSDIYLGFDTLPPLLNGSFSYVEWTGIFPNITIGTYYIGWIIDVNSVVDEGNEKNNKAYIISQLLVGLPTSKKGIPGYDFILMVSLVAVFSVIYILKKRNKV